MLVKLNKRMIDCSLAIKLNIKFWYSSASPSRLKTPQEENTSRQSAGLQSPDRVLKNSISLALSPFHGQ